MDKSLVCRECGATFVFTQGEQEFYQSHGLTNQPTRCPTCRAARRAQQGGAQPTTAPLVRAPMMEPRQLYPATCARCGQPTQVPFQPRGDRPVYCSSCFQQERLNAPAPSFAPRSAPSFRPLPPWQPSRRPTRAAIAGVSAAEPRSQSASAVHAARAGPTSQTTATITTRKTGNPPRFSNNSTLKSPPMEVRDARRRSACA